MKAIAYLRVSTDRQGDSGAGLDAQRAAITAYAAQHNIEIVRFEQDILSGSKGIEHRLGLASAIASIHKGDALLIAKRDRLGRDQFLSMSLERLVQKKGGSILSADGLGNGDSAGDKFLKSILDAASSFERDLIRARTKAAMQAKRLNGDFLGKCPFGYQVIDGKLIADANEQAVIAKIVDARNAGASLREIAAVLTAAATPTKSGSTIWIHSSINSILKRQAQLAA
jgi:DNA invertase Pin-like site-specific DNA recombinase